MGRSGTLRIPRHVALVAAITVLATVPTTRVASADGADGTDCVVPTEPSPTYPTAKDFKRDQFHNPHSVAGSARAMGADAYYRSGYYGQGVDVALIDSGVQPVRGLDGPNVIHGPDLSFEAMSPYVHLDTFGHGTHLAGIIAGNDGAGAANSFMGIAPRARVVSVKVADSAGVTDVTQVIAAITWVVQHRRDHGLNIRVINLSYGVEAIGDWQKNALGYAVDQAWRAGIVVVAAAGNDGALAGENAGGKRTDQSLSSPANNRNVLAVGAYDPVTGVADWSSRGTSGDRRMPDVVAPGVSILSMHDPGSTQDAEIADDCVEAREANREWKTPLTPDLRFVAGSGTSQAAAMVSGAAALMLSKNPGLSPDSVRQRLRTNARTLRGVDNVSRQGAGAVDLVNVMTDKRSLKHKTKPMVRSNASATAIDDARGHDIVRSSERMRTFGIPNSRFQWQAPVALTGNRGVGGLPIDVAKLQASEYASAGSRKPTSTQPWILAGDRVGSETWIGGTLVVGTQFRLHALVGGLGAPQLVLDDRPWPGTDFAGVPWGAHDWSAGPVWEGHRWRGAGWLSSCWFASNFETGLWSGRRWRGAGWSNVAWR